MFNNQPDFLRIKDLTKDLHHDNAFDLSDKQFTRMKLKMRNGFVLSVIRGDGTYGGRKNLFELAVFDKKGFADPALMGAETDDQVIGWQTLEDVIEKANILASQRRA